MIFTHKPRSVLSAIILLAASFSVPAWDDTGHKISAYIAWKHMTPPVRDRVIKILLAAPEDSHIASYYMSYGSQSPEARKRDYFMFMATWADVVRDRNFENRYRKYHHSNWHYDDVFWTTRNGKVEELPNPEDGGVALSRIDEYSKMLRGNAPDAQKAVAIAWIEHLVGDIHQPLHTSARVTDREPKGDQGGNLFLLTPEGTPRDRQENLHWFWDSIVVRNEPNKRDECDIAFLEPIAEKFMKKYPLDKMRDQIAGEDPRRWATESLTLAQTDVFSSDLRRFEAPSEKYKKNALKVAELRLALAGYRMADIFERAFAAPQGPSTVSPN